MTDDRSVARSKGGRADATVTTYTELQVGPIPSPEVLERYDVIVPGAAERILGMAEREQEHRHTWNNTMLRTQGGIVWRGQVFGLVISLFGLGVAGWLGLNDQAAAAVILGSVDLVSLVALFVVDQARSRPTTLPDRQPGPAQTPARRKFPKGGRQR